MSTREEFELSHPQQMNTNTICEILRLYSSAFVKEISKQIYAHICGHIWRHICTYMKHKPCGQVDDVTEPLTSIFLKVGDGGNEDLMEEERTAVHFDGPREKPSEVVDIPAERHMSQRMWTMWRKYARSTKVNEKRMGQISEETSYLFWEGWREDDTLSSQNFLMASVLRAWSALCV